MACGLPIILGCKLISGRERFQIPYDLHRTSPAEGSHLRNELEAQGRGQIHLGWLLSGCLIVLYLIPSFAYLQYTRGEGGGEWRVGPDGPPAPGPLASLFVVDGPIPTPGRPPMPTQPLSH